MSTVGVKGLKHCQLAMLPLIQRGNGLPGNILLFAAF